MIQTGLEQPSIGSNNSQFRGGVQGHAGQLTTCPVSDRIDKISACFYLKSSVELVFLWTL
jgi:hypothetical protein